MSIGGGAGAVPEAPALSRSGKFAAFGAGGLAEGAELGGGGAGDPL